MSGRARIRIICYLAQPQWARGWAMRVRSISGNIGICDGNAEAGPWDAAYKHIKRYSDFLYPGPDQTWVYTDEHPDSINDAGLFNPHSLQWIDMPATYHNGACGFAFADGHSEIHRFRDARTMPVLKPGQLLTLNATLFGDQDVLWMAQKAAGVAQYP